MSYQVFHLNYQIGTAETQEGAIDIIRKHEWPAMSADWHHDLPDFHIINTATGRCHCPITTVILT